MKIKIALWGISIIAASAVGMAQTWSASPILAQFPNDTTNGTGTNRIAKLTASGKAVTAGTGDTTGFIGIAQSHAGTTGNVGVAQSGIGICHFDGPTTANDYVIASTTSGGACHDASGTFPGTAVEIVGRVLSTNATAGDFYLLIYPPEIRGASGGGTWGSITGTLSSQSDLSAALAGKQSTLGYTAENSANKGTANGYAPLGADSKVPGANLPSPAWGAITGTLSSQADLSAALAGKQATLGFVPESSANKGIANGYAPLGSDSKIPAANLPAALVPTWGGITGTLSSQTDLATALAAKQDSLGYAAENTAKRGAANGYAPLGADSKVPAANLPAGSPTAWGSITGSISSQTDLSSALAGKQNTLGFTPENTTNKGVNNGYAPLDSTGKVPLANLPPQQSAPAWGSITGSITDQTDLSAALAGKQASIGYVPENVANKGAVSGYAPLDTSGKVPAANLPAVTPPAWGAITGTLANQTDLASALAGKQAALGFTAENAANKGQASGYAPLDINSKVPSANLPATTWGSITGTLSSQSDLSTALAGKQSSIGFTPENAANKGQVNGYAPLDSGGKVPSANLPAITPPVWGNITGTLSSQTDLSSALAGKQAVLGYTAENAANRGAANGYAPLGADSKVPSANLPAVVAPAWGAITGTLSSQTDLSTALAGKQATIGYTPENSANKGASNGYAPLGADSKVPNANLPSTTWGSITGTLSSQADLNTALAGKQASLGYTAENSANKGAANGYAPLGADSKVPTANLPPLPTGTVTNFSVGTLPAGLSWLTQGVTNAGTTPQYSLGLATGQAQHQFIGTGTGSTFGPVAIAQSDLPLDTYSVGTGGVTANVIVASSSNAGEVVTPAAGACGFGVAQSTTASGGTVSVKSSGLVQIITDGAIPVGHLVTCSGTTGGYITDTGATSSTRVPNTTSIIGVVTTASIGSGSLATVRIHGPGIFGTAPVHSFSAEFTAGGNVLTSGSIATVHVPYACVVNAVNIDIDTDGATFDIWKASGSKPTSANSIVGGSYPTITGGTPVHSTTLAGWSTSVSANDIVAFQLRSITGSPTNANIQVVCQ